MSCVLAAHIVCTIATTVEMAVRERFMDARCDGNSNAATVWTLIGCSAAVSLALDVAYLFALVANQQKKCINLL